jgi:nucleoside-diphosphate-sugar epimerase
MKRLKIAISGSSGFVGTNLCKSLPYEFNPIERLGVHIPNDTFCIIHAGGIAHDLKNKYKDSDYFEINTRWTQNLFDSFINSSADIFIFFSSIKAVADKSDFPITENIIPDPTSEYGRSKLLAEQYIQGQRLPKNKRVFILRPCMIHGPGNKGNLNTLYKYVLSGAPWPFGGFVNNRSFCSIGNVIFAVQKFIENDYIPSGVYNLADSEPLSTLRIVGLIQSITGKNNIIFDFPKSFIILLALMGDFLNLKFNTETLQKFTQNFIVSNSLIEGVINISLPISSEEGMKTTISSFEL